MQERTAHRRDADRPARRIDQIMLILFTALAGVLVGLTLHFLLRGTNRWGKAAALPETTRETSPCVSPTEETVQSQETALPHVLTPEEIRRAGSLVLINGRFIWPQEIQPDLITIADRRPANLVGLKSEEMRADASACDALMQMLSAAKDDGVTGYTIVSSYRGYEKQDTLFQERVQELVEQGLTRTQAHVRANETVALPGSSEHHTGLAFDLISQDNGWTLESFSETPQQLWLQEHCAAYGFILRYPEDKAHLTGIGSEPWHYRYVGVEHAQRMKELGMCLEEYAEYLTAGGS